MWRYGIVTMLLLAWAGVTQAQTATPTATPATSAEGLAILLRPCTIPTPVATPATSVAALAILLRPATSCIPPAPAGIACPVCCAVGSKNRAIWDARHNCNGFIIPAKKNWEPSVFTAPQTVFRVPSGDIACITLQGCKVAVTGEQE